MIHLYDLGKPYRHPARRWAHFVLCAGLGGLISSAQAQTGAPFTLNNFTPNPGLMPGGGWTWTPGSTFADPPSRTFTPTPGGAIVEDGLQIATKAGQLPVRVRQAVTVADAAAAVARCLTRSVVCAAVAAVGAAYLYKKYRTRPDGNGGLVADPGQPPEQHANYNCGVSPDGKSSFDGTSPEAACTLAIKFYDYDYTDVNGAHRWRVSTLTSCTPTACTFDYSVGSSRPGYPTISNGSTATLPVAQRGTTGLCPAVVDFYDPAYSTPGGPPGADGLCPTGVYSQRVTPEQAAQRVVVAPPTDSSLSDALHQSISQGESAPSSITSSGPATQTGQPVTTTTTGPAGTSTTTQTPTYAYHYDGDKISYDTTVTTTVINNDGSTSSSSTTTSGPSPDKEPKDPCDLHPERVGCMGLGNPPDDTVKKTQSRLSWQS